MVASETLRIETAEVFEPLLQPARYKGAHGGRGSGKSHFFAEDDLEECLRFPGWRIACVREVQKSLEDSVKRLLEDKIESLGVQGYFEVQRDRIITPGDGVIRFLGMQDHTAESIKSLEGFDAAHVEEAQNISQRSLELLRPTIRNDPKPGRPGSTLKFSWNRRSSSDPVDKLLTGLTPPKNSIVVQANWQNNPFFPSVLEEERLHDQENNRDRYGHIWEGDYEPQAIGAIWNRAMFHQHRKTMEQVPELTRIAVAIDPQGKKAMEPGETDDTGIVAAGVGIDGRGYVLADETLNGSPHQWATRTVSVHDAFDADLIVGEVNNGGDMVEHTVRTVRPTIKYKAVTATRGKHVRAEPISSLYEKGYISHVGTFGPMEDELCLMTAYGYEGKGSPNRADALVWCLTELFPKMTKKTPSVKVGPRIIRAAEAGASWMGS